MTVEQLPLTPGEKVAFLARAEKEIKTMIAEVRRRRQLGISPRGVEARWVFSTQFLNMKDDDRFRGFLLSILAGTGFAVTRHDRTMRTVEQFQAAVHNVAEKIKELEPAELLTLALVGFISLVDQGEEFISLVDQGD